jgi:outer membrane protein assembly factor BamB
VSIAAAKSPDVSPPKPVADEERKPRLWFPVLVAVAYWVVFFAVGRMDLDLGTMFFSRMGAAAVALIAGTIWWWCNGRIPLRDRALQSGVFIVGMIAASVLSHKSIGPFMMFFMGTGVVLTAATLGLVAARNANNAVRRFLVAGSMIVACLGYTLIRLDGIAGNGDAEFAWRWAATSEDIFLAGQKEQPSSPPIEMPHDVVEARPGDWTEFRGVDRAGVVTAGDIETDWKAHPPKLVWKKPVGPAWSAMIVVAGRLYTQEQRGDKEAVVCYDAATGNELWHADYEARFEETVSGAGPRATPTFVDGRIYAFGAKGELLCLDAGNGDVRWRRATVDDSHGDVPMWGFAGSPLVVDDLVVVFAGGKREAATNQSLLAYRSEDGKLAWSADGGFGSFSSPQLATIGGRKAVLFLGELGLQAFDPVAGERIWQWGQKRDQEWAALQPHVPSSDKLGERLYVVHSEGTAEVKVTTDGDAPQFESGWLSKDLKPDFNDFVIYQDHAYGFDREIFTCIDLETGKRKWKGGRYGHGQVILLEDKGLLLVLGEKGQVALVRASSQKTDELAKFQAISGKTWNHPVLVDGKLYVRNAQEMACYDLRSGSQAASDTGAE